MSWYNFWKPAIKVLKNSAMLITPQQLKDICTHMGLDRATKMAALLNELCEKYGVKNQDVFEEFLANVLQESLEFQHKVENMNYRAETLMKVWPSRFPTMAIAGEYARNPEKLANKVYGGRMGNNQPGDGYKFKGGGFIGLTGREVYTKYAAYLNEPVEQVAQKVQIDDRYALDSAFWFFCILKDLEDEAIKDDFIGIVKSINGGTIGLKDRQFYYARVKSVMK
jgi:putative chitinase